MSKNLNRLLVIITQIFLVSIFRLSSWYIVKRIYSEKFKTDASTKYIMYSNHRWTLDPFLVCSNLQLAELFKLMPFRFFVKNRFYEGMNILLRPILMASGCFPAKWHSRLKYGLTTAEEYLYSNNTVVIFPEGKVSKTGLRLPARRGIEVLANIPDTELIPIKVHRERKILLYKSYSIVYGKPINGRNMTAEQIMDVVYSLKFR